MKKEDVERKVIEAAIATALKACFPSGNYDYKIEDDKLEINTHPIKPNVEKTNRRKK